MAYDVHITRRQYWIDDGDDISLEEWKSYVASDPEMRMDGHATWSDQEITLRVDDESIAVWLAHPDRRPSDNLVYLMLYRGNIDLASPDKPILIKMAAIARALSARVQGDELEIYGEDGEQIGIELPNYIPADEDDK